MRTHFGDKGKNLAWFQQEGDLKMPDGKMSNHISGLQNDWAAEYAKNAKHPDFRRSEWQIETAEGPRVFSHNDLQDFVMTNYPKESWNEVIKTAKLYNPNPPVPEPPMKDTWWKTGLRDAVKRAVEAGHDYLSWDTAEIQSKRYPDPNPGTHKYFQEHYDQKIPKQLAKEYGVKPERVKVGEDSQRYKVAWANQVEDANGFADTRTHAEYFNTEESADYFMTHFDEAVSGTDRGRNVRIYPSVSVEGKKSAEVWRIPITEEMKRKVLLEGQYFTKQTAKPGGRNAEMAA
jgi:hypothetical protein